MKYCNNCGLPIPDSNTTKCSFCGNSLDALIPNQDMPNLDITILHQKAIELVNSAVSKSIPHLSICPYCDNHSLFYNVDNSTFSCLNIACEYHDYNIHPYSPQYGYLIKTLREAALLKDVSLTRLQYDIYTTICGSKFMPGYYFQCTIYGESGKQYLGDK